MKWKSRRSGKVEKSGLGVRNTTGDTGRVSNRFDVYVRLSVSGNKYAGFSDE
jgi:hypothetical protein